MEDKLAKVRAEIERLHEESRNKKGALYYRKALRAVLYLIDSMQEEPKKCMYSKEDYTDEDRKVLCEDCKEKCEYSKQEEPVSNGLEEAIEDAMPDANWYIEENNDTIGEDAYNSIQMGNMFKAGAQWRKEKMMAKVFPAEIDSSRSDGRCILSGNFARFETGERVKVIVIKED